MTPRSLLNTRLGCIAFALIGLSRGVIYLPIALGASGTDAPRSIAAFTEAIPLTVWASLWIAAGLACIVGIIKPSPVWCIGVGFMGIVWTVAYSINPLDWRFLGSAGLFFGLALAAVAFIGITVDSVPPRVSLISPPRPEDIADGGEQ